MHSIEWIASFYREEDNWSSTFSPFETLIATVLSQATSDKNSHAAFGRLRDQLEITPKVLSQAPIQLIEGAIRTGGLYHQKALKINGISRALACGDLMEMMKSQDARERLLELSGVGRKTADVLLCFRGNRDVVPIDTHIKRISARVWGFRGDYDSVQKELHGIIEPKKRKKTHIAMIRFGREICRAKAPLCEICDIRGECLYYLSRDAPSAVSHS